MSDLFNHPPDSNENDLPENEGLLMQHCIIQQDSNDVLITSKVVQRALRRLRQSLLNCEICPEIHQCELRESFNGQVNLVIAEINEEWGW